MPELFLGKITFEKKGYWSTAPRFAGPTAAAYLVRTLLSGFVRGFHPDFLLSISSIPISRLIVLEMRSIDMVSPSFTNAIGPPAAASGATCPIHGPLVPPENRPSVIRATRLYPRPTSADVGEASPAFQVRLSGLRT